ncbi:hypothetical protein ALP53_200005 [Pseudomonas savastanoi pv. phaseolicola]|nr:hypothetical protein ALP53_200005 [Pseudomonas savastanoi pv. phaseolicola]
MLLLLWNFKFAAKIARRACKTPIVPLKALRFMSLMLMRLILIIRTIPVFVTVYRVHLCVLLNRVFLLFQPLSNPQGPNKCRTSQF